MFLERFFDDPHHPTSSTFHCYPPPHPPPLPPPPKNFDHTPRGSSYLPLPDWLAKTGAIINPKNSDIERFKWAVIAAMKWREIGDHPERISKLKRYEDDFDWVDMKFSASFRDNKRFESRNEITICIRT